MNNDFKNEQGSGLDDSYTTSSLNITKKTETKKAKFNPLFLILPLLALVAGFLYSQTNKNDDKNVVLNSSSSLSSTISSSSKVIISSSNLQNFSSSALTQISTLSINSSTTQNSSSANTSSNSSETNTIITTSKIYNNPNFPLTFDYTGWSEPEYSELVQKPDNVSEAEFIHTPQVVLKKDGSILTIRAQINGVGGGPQCLEPDQKLALNDKWTRIRYLTNDQTVPRWYRTADSFVNGSNPEGTNCPGLAVNGGPYFQFNDLKGSKTTSIMLENHNGNFTAADELVKGVQAK